MFCRLVIWFCLLIVTLTVQTPAAWAEKITVATYNMENFFDVWDDPYTADGDPKPLHETQAVGQMLKALDADIIGVCEVENEAVIKRLVDEAVPNEGYDTIAVAGGNDGRGIKLGLVSKYPVRSITSYRFNELTIPGSDQTWRMARDVFHAQVQVGEKTLHIMMLHFKSKRDSDGDPQSANWRLAEALFVRGLVDQLLEKDPKALVAVMGDLNDTIDSPTLAALLKGNSLIDAHRRLPKNTITYLRAPYKSKIDFILTTPALARMQRSAKVMTDPALLEGSDHAPILVSFEIQ